MCPTGIPQGRRRSRTRRREPAPEGPGEPERGKGTVALRASPRTTGEAERAGRTGGLDILTRTIETEIVFSRTEPSDSRSDDGIGPNTGGDIGRPGSCYRQSRIDRWADRAAHADRAKTRPRCRTDLPQPGRLRHAERS